MPCTNKLTNTKIKNLKPREKEYPVADGGGLAIYVTHSGVKKWRFRYRFNNNATMISLGKYPIVSLLEARAERDECKALLHKGINPVEHRKQLKSSKELNTTFRSMFYAWFERHKSQWSERTAKKNIASFETHIFPYIGNTPVTDITALNMLETFRVMDDKGIHEVLKKTRGWTSRVFQDCVVSGLIPFDPTRDLPRDSFSKAKVKHYATVTSTKDITNLINAISSYDKKGSYEVSRALILAPYLFLRPSELTGLLWEEVDFENKLIRIKANRMKQSKEHLVPMSSFVVSAINEIKELALSSDYVFPSPLKENESINAESLRAAIRKLDISKEVFTTHGFRGMASTRLHEMGFNSDIIEMQLSHSDRNQSRKAYNHAQYLNERREMMQQWSDYLDKVKLP